MKPTCKDFKAQRSSSVGLPPAGAYVAEIKDAHVVTNEFNGREVIEMMIEITEGEYAGRFTEVWQDQRERFGDAKYKGIFRLMPYTEDDEDWVKRKFSSNIWCIQESNPSYSWDWDEKKLKGKKIGISLRNRLYTYNGQDRSTVEIGQFETVEDVKAGKCKQMRDRDQRKHDEEASTDGSEFTDVSKNVDVPWA